jgi:hypothetical protein
MAEPYRVDLCYLGGPVILVPAATGIIYANQVDGIACVQRELEGYLVRLPRLDDEIFAPEWWAKSYNRRVFGSPAADAAWAEICARIEAALARLPVDGECPERIRIVPHAENAEAWVHVAFDLAVPGETESGATCVPRRGVLTWES